jgi:hypothetical protein
MTAVIEANVIEGIVIEQEFLPDGTLVFVGRDMNLDGCIVQEASSEAARAAVIAARAEYIALSRELQRSTPHSGLLTPLSDEMIDSMALTRTFAA